MVASTLKSSWLVCISCGLQQRLMERLGAMGQQLPHPALDPLVGLHMDAAGAAGMLPAATMLPPPGRGGIEQSTSAARGHTPGSTLRPRPLSSPLQYAATAPVRSGEGSQPDAHAAGPLLGAAAGLKRSR